MSRKKEIIKIRAETNEVENRKAIDKINETKNRFFEKLIIDMCLARLTKIKRETNH